MERLVWLHLSDLHRGQPGERTRWGTAREALLSDLRAQAQRQGAPDLILLTGDLAFSGQRREYERVDESLTDIRAAVGGEPLVVTVPGNHDLARPAEGSVLARGLDHYHDDERLRREVLRPRSDTHKSLTRLFAEYDRFWKRSILPGWEAERARGRLRYKLGLFPGDFVLSVERGGLRVCIVGLNSALLQLRGGDYERRLSVEPEQLPGADLPAELAAHDAALLLMHHPPDWLSERSRRLFEQYLFTPGRFTACLFGHMHASRARTELGATLAPRRYLQASSLFGLEHCGSASETREIGYALYALRRTGPTQGVLARHARRGVLRDDGAFELDRDQATRDEFQRFPVDLAPARPAPLLTSGAGEKAGTGETGAPRTPGASLLLVPDRPNPFLHTGRVTDPARFVGRRALLRQLFEELHKGSSRALLGDAQIGKSSILSMVCRLGPARLDLAPERFVYLDMQLISDEDDFWDALCGGLGVDVASGFRLERQLRGRRYVVCIDEIEKMHSASFPRSVREQLRGLADGDGAPLKLVIASRVPLDQIFPDAPGQTSPLSNLCPHVTVPPFSAAECRDLITSRLAGTGVTFDEAAIDALVRESGGVPVRLLDRAAHLFAELTR